MARPRVILARCTDYDANRITDIVTRGMEQLDARPYGKTLLKPNIVIAHDVYFQHAYTRPEFAEGVLRATRERGKYLESVRIAERCGITIPTRMAFSQAGYNKLSRRHDVELVNLDEETQVEFELTHEHRLRDYLYTPEAIATCDYMITMPKFKAHPWTTVTFALKNWIGIQDDRHRMIDHDYNLDRKIADLQEIVQPDFIAIDAIIGGQDRMLTAVPYDLGLVIMGDNSVATDAVCCAILDLDPAEVDHIRYCHERGLGPIDLDQIEILGDVSLEQAQKDAKGFRKGLVRVEDYFEGSRIKAYAGPAGEDADCDYCWGGCPGAMEEAIEIIRTTDPKVDETMKPIHVVFGQYDGQIDAKPGEKVLFFGDCTAWKGKLAGQAVEAPNDYEPARHKDPHHARFLDVMFKMLLVFVQVFRSRGQPHIKVNGCPVSVAEHVLYISRCGKTKNPYFDPRIVVPFFLSWVTHYVVVFFKRLWGSPYQKKRKELEP